MSYIALKHIHLTCILLTFILFSIRGFWMLTGSSKLQLKWVKIAPHVVDTCLLLSAISLAVILQISPFVHGWLMAKIVGLVVYILLGTVALKRGKTKAVRSTAFVVALLTFAYIVKVAITKSATLF
ncbi:SirB2 family protein [Alkalimarinus alittae]|uniref:SirB2 family protein n=1 Tax=Alkalimarinus alittae TaxID=2961619 RepID=A0ABY6MYZ4_9ALTE|nr:SirB2 family protein [Alkalimarinus alittae]UZE95061.1 SirB2 family protein [Alkalimarinus alittae]